MNVQDHKLPTTIHDTLDTYWVHLYQSNTLYRYLVLLSIATLVSILCNIIPFYLSLLLIGPIGYVIFTSPSSLKAGEWNPLTKKGSFATKSRIFAGLLIPILIFSNYIASEYPDVTGFIINGCYPTCILGLGWSIYLQSQMQADVEVINKKRD